MNNPLGKDVLTARGLCKAYTSASGTFTILDQLDLTVQEGEIVAILGASGVGKSTLLHVLGLLDTPDSGELSIDSQPVSGLFPEAKARLRNRTIGFIFQFYHLLHECDALANVLLPAQIATPWWKWSSVKKSARERAEKLLADVGLADRMNHRSPMLSGGEKQRVAIARALMQNPAILLCDEPTGNLDPATAATVQSLLWRINQLHRTAMVVVTHDPSIARQAHRVLVLEHGRLHAASAPAGVSPA